jgi:two-component system, cell cycle sensor histidine kinase and response regulator CckA
MSELNLQDARILIVDDQEPNVLFLESLLHEGGYHSWRAVLDPRTAAAACAEFQPDLILLDLLMPDLDGFGVLGQLQPLLAAQAYLPVLVLTVDLTTEAKRRALAAGAKDFLAKPLDAIEVLLRVKNLLETRFLYRRLQERADERIREQAALIDQANDAILVCDLDGRITFWSRGARKLYGWTAAQALGSDAAELLFSICPLEWAEANRAMTATGRWEGELAQVARDARQMIVASRWTLLHDAAGQPRSRLIINTDVTEKKKTEAKLLRAQRMETIYRLGSGIAHDLNNILTPLAMGLDLLPMTYRALDESLLAMMRTSVRRGTDLIRQILTFARGLEGARRPVPLRPVVDELTGFFRQTFPKSITIATELPDNLWLVNADPTQLYQLLANLCINARDAMPAGGMLRITARNQSRHAAGARHTPELSADLYVVLAVEDTGTGITADVLDRLFEPFFTTKEVGKGTGLGLATAQSIVRSHGGWIEVASTAGKGSRFTVYLPAVDAPAPPLAEAEAREPPGGKGELLLIVDDEAAHLHIASLVLTQAGYRVLTASNGAEALTLYAEQPQGIHAVLMDMIMPVMGGAQAIQALRRLNPAVKIIAFTGLYTVGATGQAVVADVQAVLPKPYTVRNLLATVRSVLDARLAATEDVRQRGDALQPESGRAAP